MLEAIILGIVQGVTEFLPVSSTAHLILFPWFFNWGGDVDTLTFDVALHAGTLSALILCFWRDWIELVSKKQKEVGSMVGSPHLTNVYGVYRVSVLNFSLSAFHHKLCIETSCIIYRHKGSEAEVSGIALLLVIGISMVLDLQILQFICHGS